MRLLPTPYSGPGHHVDGHAPAQLPQQAMASFRLDDTGAFYQMASASPARIRRWVRAPRDDCSDSDDGEMAPREAVFHGFHGFFGHLARAASEEEDGASRGRWGFSMVLAPFCAVYFQLRYLLLGPKEVEGYAPRWDPLAETRAGIRRRNYLGCFVLLLIGLPGCIASLLLLQEMVDPAVRRVAPADVATVQSIFFGGQPWVVYCVDGRTGASAQHLPLLNKAAEILRPEGIRVAEVHCWVPLPTKAGTRTLAERFRFRHSPPVVMLASGREKPRFLHSQPGSARQLADGVKRAAEEAAKATAAKEKAEAKKAEAKGKGKAEAKKRDL